MVDDDRASPAMVDSATDELTGRVQGVEALWERMAAFSV